MKRLRQTQLPFCTQSIQTATVPQWHDQLPIELWGEVARCLLSSETGNVPYLGTVLTLIGVSRRVADVVWPVICRLIAEIKRVREDDHDTVLPPTTQYNTYLCRFIGVVERVITKFLSLDLTRLCDAWQFSAVTSVMHLIELEKRYCWFQGPDDDNEAASQVSVSRREGHLAEIPPNQHIAKVMYFRDDVNRAEYVWRCNDVFSPRTGVPLQSSVRFGSLLAWTGDRWRSIDHKEASRIRERCFMPTSMHLTEATRAFILDRDHDLNRTVALQRLRELFV